MFLRLQRLLQRTEADVVEWRGDWFDRVEDRDELLEVLQGIRGRIREKALLFTLRQSMKVDSLQ